MKMQKRKKAIIVMMAALAFSLGTTSAMAAPSPVSGNTTILADVVDVVESIGTVSELTLADITDANTAIQNYIAEIISSARTSDVSTQGFDGNGDLILDDDGTPLGTSSDPEVIAAFDFTPSAEIAAEIESKGSASVEFNVEGIQAGDAVRIFHYLSAEDTWEIIVPTSVADGVVVAPFKSFSPIVIAKLPAGVAQLEEALTVTPTTVSTIPIYYIISAIALVIVLGVGAVYAFSRSKKNVKSNKRR